SPKALTRRVAVWNMLTTGHMTAKPISPSAGPIQISGVSSWPPRRSTRCRRGSGGPGAGRRAGAPRRFGRRGATRVGADTACESPVLLRTLLESVEDRLRVVAARRSDDLLDLRVDRRPGLLVHRIEGVGRQRIQERLQARIGLRHLVRRTVRDRQQLVLVEEV